MRRSILVLALVIVAAAQTAEGATVARSPLDGLWKLTHKATKQELVAGGMPSSQAAALAVLPIETPAVEFHAGHARWFDLATGKVYALGTYEVRGNRVGIALSWVRNRRTWNGRKDAAWLSWSVYRDLLAFSSYPGGPEQPWLTISPWVRVT
jgi:hypothetical protein